MMGRHRVFFIMMLCGVCLSAGAQTATEEPQTFYVDAAYTGPEVGTSDRPFAHITPALALAQIGRSDTIKVRRGTYNERFIIPIGTNLVSEDGPFNTFIEDNTGTLVRMENGAVIRGFSVGGTSGTAVEVFNTGTVEVSNCILHGSGSGLYVNANAQVWCINNTIYDNTSGIQSESLVQFLPLANNAFISNGVGISTAASGTVNSLYNAFYQNGTAYAGAFVPGAHDLLTADPMFVDPADQNFHLKHGSGLRNAGDPAEEYNDRNGSRNDIGADGGPRGAIDLLLPQIVIDTIPAPAQGPVPLAVFADASLSSDEWGIYSVEWDVNMVDGLTFGDGNGTSIASLFDEPGGYVVAVRVTDNSGNSSIATTSVRVGTPPQVVHLNISPSAGPAPLTVAFNIEAVSLIGGAMTFAWDFNNDNVRDSAEQNPTYTFPAGTEPGIQFVSLAVINADGVPTTLIIPVTISAYPILASLEVKPGHAGVIAVEEKKSALYGLRVDIPSNAVNDKTVFAVSEAPTDEIPAFTGAVELNRFDLSPHNLLLCEPIQVEVPVTGAGLDESNVEIRFWNTLENTWAITATSHLRVSGGKVSFETTNAGTFAVVTTVGAGGPCFIADGRVWNAAGERDRRPARVP